MEKQTIEQVQAVRDAYFETIESVKKHEGKEVAFLVDTILTMQSMNKLMMITIDRAGIPFNTAKPIMDMIATMESDIVGNAAELLQVKEGPLKSVSKWVDTISDSTEARLNSIAERMP